MQASRENRVRTLGLSLLVAASLVAPGCAQYRIYQADAESHGFQRYGQNTPSTPWEESTSHSLVWGLLVQDTAVTRCQDETGRTWGLEEVQVDRNALHFAASFLTLGFWSPATVKFRCAKPCAPGTSL